MSGVVSRRKWSIVRPFRAQYLSKKTNSRVMALVIFSSYVTSICVDEVTEAMSCKSSKGIRQIRQVRRRGHASVTAASEGIVRVLLSRRLRASASSFRIPRICRGTIFVSRREATTNRAEPNRAKPCRSGSEVREATDIHERAVVLSDFSPRM